MKICSKCKKRKTNTSFYWLHKIRGYRRAICKKCEGKKFSAWWKKSTSKERASKYAYNIKHQRKRVWRNIGWIASYLKCHPCIKCGESNIIVLEFHHRNPKKKHNGVSQLSGTGKSLDLVITEINKCDVLCANCHRIETAYQRNYKILKFI